MLLLFYVTLLLISTATDGFQFGPICVSHHKYDTRSFRTRRSPSFSSTPSVLSSSCLRSVSLEQSSMLWISEVDEWRQYVPLIVSFGVILDILLGSPLANLVLGPMRRAATGSNANNGDDENGPSSTSGFDVNASRFTRNPKERVDSDALAQAALQKARYSMELRQFLEANKTDEQRYDEMRKRIDKQADELEDNLEKMFDKK